MTSNTGKIAAIAGGTCVFVGGMVGFPFHIMGDLAVSLPLALATGGGLWKFWPNNEINPRTTIDDIRRLDAEMASLNGAGGVSQREVIEAITTGTDKLDRILREAVNIRSPNTIRRIKHIDALGRKIIEDFRQDPADVRKATSWLGISLDQMLDCVRQYAQLSQSSARSLEAQKQMAAFDSFLDDLHDATQKLLDKLLENDSTNFQVNMEVFRSQIKNEGL